MMDANQSSKKRKLPPTPSHPLVGISTRRKSQIQLHRTLHSHDSSYYLKNSDLHVLIKDLRTRRVFSPKSIDSYGPNLHENVNSIQKLGVAVENLDQGISCGGGENMEKKNLVLSSAVEEYPLDENNGVDPYTDESEEVQKFDWGISCKTQVLVGVNPPSSLATEGDGLKGDSDDKGVVDDGETDGLLKGTDDLNECDFQTTPPDSEAFGNGHANEKGGKPPIESTQRIDTCVGRAFGNDYKEKKNDSISSFKSVLKPCSRRKLFKTPGSFSYKRMLPFLMDIEKDNSYIPESAECPKPEKCLGQKLLQPKLGSNGEEAAMHKSITNSCSMECYTADSGNSANESSDGNMAGLTSSKHFTESLIPIDSKKLVDDCHEKLLVNGKLQKSELGFTSKDHEIDLKPVLSSGLEDNAKGQNDNVETEERASRIPRKARDDVNTQLSLIKHECLPGRDYGVAQRSDDVQQSETGGMKKPSNCPFKAQSLNPIFPELDNNKSSNLELRYVNDGMTQSQIDDSNEEHVQVTPDAEILTKADAEENGRAGVDFFEKSTDHALGKPLLGDNTRSANRASDRRNSNSESKLVLNPCSRLKLYRSSGSFSYRRLLPFLVELTKDNSSKSCFAFSMIILVSSQKIASSSSSRYFCSLIIERSHLLSWIFLVASGNGYCSKSEKDKEEMRLPSCVASNCQENPVVSNGHSFHAEHQASHSGNLPMIGLNSAQYSSNVDEQKLKSPQDDPEPTISLDSLKEHQFQVEQVKSDRYSQLETSPNQVIAVSCGTLSREEGITTVSRMSFDTEVDCVSSFRNNSSCSKPVEADGLSGNISQHGASVPPAIVGTGLLKGILKRNPRGCRGLCTCLNCASFRLHAERAFEFSRNQMQDAEEVALDLIKELSYLRNMLQKSADGLNDHPTVHVNQMQEACRKASEAAELAKHRLGQMNYELNIHGRITCLQPPRVRFANYVEESVTPEADSHIK
ncbi:uncharacterized protein LOC122315618 isoform X2 [Carya illinoinensis]|uniref:uncharacterized protein LOC122315618 isoform X2 n=1 Tax=Carya illinoinensis TaxID=32201 RepID=UPI001C727AFE|nr:uncharacterized protein LOC122315618 isoform X2 [Carya illinoinensis]